MMPQASIYLNDMNLEHGYSPWKGYCQSKLACLLFAYELSRRLVGTQITVNALHPGVVNTGLWDHYAPNFPLGSFFFNLFIKYFTITAEQGAQTQIYVATSKECETETGKFTYLFIFFFYLFYKNKQKQTKNIYRIDNR